MSKGRLVRRSFGHEKRSVSLHAAVEVRTHPGRRAVQKQSGLHGIYRGRLGF